MRTPLVMVWLVGCSGDAALPDGGVDAPSTDPRLAMAMRDQVAAIEAGTFTGGSLAQAYLDHIAVVDRTIHAVLALDPQAAPRADALDTMRGAGAPLQGAVIVLKDNIDTAGLATTAGSLAMINNIPSADAFVVARLHAAHGLVLAKTNLSEWANFRSTRSISGWSSRGGQTTNGRVTTHNPCGSSSGSAAAVAASMASAALGTETNGSIICPASVNGVVGFKPTVGLVSRAGVVPISQSQDSVGPITRTVGDAARLLSVIAGPDANDPATQAIPPGMSFDFEAPLATATLQGKRLGFVNLGYDANTMALFDQERARLVAAGAQVIDVTLTTAIDSNDEQLVLESELKDGLDRYLAAHPVAGQAASLQALIDYDTANAATVMPYFGQELFIAAQATAGLTAQAYLDALQRLRDGSRTNGIDATLAANNLDALICPSSGPAWPLSTASDPGIIVASGPAAVAGYPHLTVPMGKLGVLPVGLSFFGKAWDDAAILALGYAYEQLPR